MRDPNDELGGFQARFTGEIGSEAHRAHHETLMARLGARAFASETAHRRRVARVAAGSKSMSCAAKKIGTTVADVRSCVRTQRRIDSANR